MWQRTWRIMELLGIDEELSAAAERPPNKTLGECSQIHMTNETNRQLQARDSSIGVLTEPRTTTRSTES